MTDLKNIPSELRSLLKLYALLSNITYNAKATLDIYRIDLKSLEDCDLQNIVYSNLDKIINAQTQMSHIYELIEDFMKNKLNINFSNISIWESKIEYS